MGLAQALIHDPQVLILDEPTTGLDPNQIVEIRNLIKEVSQSKTVLFSTHIMQEVQALCERVVIIDNGTIAADQSVDQLQAESKQAATGLTIKVDFKNPVERAELLKIKGIETVNEDPLGGFLLKTKDQQDVRSEIFEHAVAQNWILVEMQLMTESLEEIFQGLTGSGGKDD